MINKLNYRPLRNAAQVQRYAWEGALEYFHGLGLVLAWQFLSFIIVMRLKSKLGGRKGREIATDSGVKGTSLSAGRAQEFLRKPTLKTLTRGV